MTKGFCDRFLTVPCCSMYSVELARKQSALNLKLLSEDSLSLSLHKCVIGLTQHRGSSITTRHCTRPARRLSRAIPLPLGQPHPAPVPPTRRPGPAAWFRPRAAACAGHATAETAIRSPQLLGQRTLPGWASPDAAGQRSGGDGLAGRPAGGLRPLYQRWCLQGRPLGCGGSTAAGGTRSGPQPGGHAVGRTNGRGGRTCLFDDHQ